MNIRKTKSVIHLAIGLLLGNAALADTTIVGGESHSVALRADGTVFTWGRNNYGQLGNGSTNNSLVPMAAKNFSGAKSIAVGDNHTLVAKADGTAWSWGYNGYGQLGKGDTTEVNSPVPVLYLSGVSTVAAGCNFSLALTNDQTVWSWGSNDSGQLGYVSNNKSAPIKIPSLDNVVSIVAGCDSGYALKADGSVWAWGNNSYGQLGDGTKTNSNVPKLVSGTTGIKAIAAGNSHVVALKQDGTLLTWGKNDYNYCQLGNSVDQYGYCRASSAPAPVAGISGITQIAATSANTVALKTDGTVWVWGSNYYGQLGNGSGNNSLTPVQVSGLNQITEVASSKGDHLLARKASGEVYAWGRNNYGQLGQGDSNDYSVTPVQVLGAGGDGKLNLVSAGATTVSTELCKATVTNVTGIGLEVPCADFAGKRYQLKFVHDPAIVTGVYFKMIDIR